MQIPAAYVQHILDGPRSKGADINAIWQRAKLSVTLRNALKNGLNSIDYSRLSRAVTLTLDDELMGITSRPQRIGSFALVAAHASQAETVLSAYRRMVWVFNLFENSYAMKIETHRGQMRFDLKLRAGDRVLNPLAVETTLGACHRLMSWLGGSLTPIDSVWLDYPRPDYAASYRALFLRAPIRYGATTSGLSMPLSALQRPILRNEDQAMNWARRTPFDAFLPMETAGTLSQQVASEIERILGETGSIPEMQTIASALNIPQHTLRRRLQREGAEYLAVRTQVRRDMAIRLLNTSDLPMDTIATRTGFSEASAFVRAFKTWTGLTPRAYRVLN